MGGVTGSIPVVPTIANLGPSANLGNSSFFGSRGIAPRLSLHLFHIDPDQDSRRAGRSQAGGGMFPKPSPKPKVRASS